MQEIQRINYLKERSHLISLPLSCPIQPVLCWGDKKGSANTLPTLVGE